MPAPKKLPDLALGKRFPQRLLNALPGAWKRRRLLNLSGGERQGDGFDATTLRDVRKILVIWPDSREELLMAFPAVRALLDALDPGVECAHLCEADNATLAQGLFPEHPVKAWSRADLAWYDPAVQSLVGGLKVFAPDLTLNLSRACPSVLQAAVNAAGAPLRLGWENGSTWPYANIRLAPDEATPLPVRAFQFLDLWRYAGFTPRTHWTRIQSDAEKLVAAGEAWSFRRAEPGDTWLYLHDATSGRPFDAALYSWLRERVLMRDPGEFTLGAVLWDPAGTEIAREGGWRDAPVFSAGDFSDLLGLLDGARGVTAFQGFGLHFASLIEVRCLGLLNSDEAIYDASAVNPLFEADWI